MANSVAIPTKRLESGIERERENLGWDFILPPRLKSDRNVRGHCHIALLYINALRLIFF
jgi:hypothetical protein